MFEKHDAALESIAASLAIIAAALKDASLKALPGGTAAAVPAPATAAAPPTAQTGPTKESVLSRIREFSDKHGRDEAKKVMAAAGIKNVKDIKPEQIAPFDAALTKAEAEKASAVEDDGLS